MTIEMKPVFLLIDEERETDSNVIQVVRDFYEMPEYKENPTDEEIESFLRSELGETVENVFVGNEGVWFKLRGKNIHFAFQKALKIGKQYFKLEQLKTNYTENV